jgi:fermentation-respiration switch protein FrsA (DUF1100 family)
MTMNPSNIYLTAFIAVLSAIAISGHARGAAVEPAGQIAAADGYFGGEAWAAVAPYATRRHGFDVDPERPTGIWLSSEGPTRLAIRVYDDRGALVASEQSSGGVTFIQLSIKATRAISIAVQNEGEVPHKYFLAVSPLG